MRSIRPLAVALLITAAAQSASAGQTGGQVPTFLIPDPAAIVVPSPPGAAETEAELAALRAEGAIVPEDLALRLRRWEAGGPVYRWNEVAVAALVDQHILIGPASRILALLHAGLHDVSVVVAAVKTAQVRPPPWVLDASLARAATGVPRSSYPSETAAIGAAASAILSALVPAETERFRALAADGIAVRRLAGLEFPSDAAAGAAVGDAVAALALARAKEDGFDRRWTGPVPTGPGRWQGTAPLAPLAGTWRAWLLAANDAIRPPPPPAHDSPETAAQLAELKAFRRTPKTNADAVFWEVNGGARGFQLWNLELSRKVLEYGVAEHPARTAAIYATFATAYYDAFIACWDAKFTYWHIRPSQLDPTLTTVVPPPAHPSYPAAHACLSTAAGTVLAALFPPDAPALLALARQAGEARIAAGIHFRYDIEAGDEIGRQIAAMALAKLAPALK